jgi:hypothetical protein
VADDNYLIWSNEHKSWWGPNRAGYVARAVDAGCYSHAEALKICSDAIPGTSKAIGMLPELPVRLDDVGSMFASFVNRFPGHDPEPQE